MTKPSVPRDVAIRRAAELRAKMLRELEAGPRLTRQLAALFEVDSAEAHRSLSALREAGMVSSTLDRRMSVFGVVQGVTWVLTGKEAPDDKPIQPRRKVAKGQWPAPPRDPQLWALYGEQP